jgi:hypothetical protein
MNSAKVRLFILAGMPRTATTFLYQRFLEHPAIFCPYRKETNFFSVNYDKGLDWYRGLYAGIADGQVAADVSPAYFLDELAVDRIRAFEPKTPVILGVRPASEWALSWYTQVMTHHWGARPSLEEFLTGYAFQISGGEIWQDFRNGFVSRMIDRYRQAFGDNLLLYHQSAFRENPLTVVNSIEHFVGVSRYFSEENFRNEVVNAGTRRNIGIATYLLSREGFVDAVGRLVPRRLVQAARNAYVAMGTSKKALPKPSFTAEEIALSKQIFSDDDSWIESLFADSQIQLGSGGAFAMGENGVKDGNSDN